MNYLRTKFMLGFFFWLMFWTSHKNVIKKCCKDEMLAKTYDDRSPFFSCELQLYEFQFSCTALHSVLKMFLK